MLVDHSLLGSIKESKIEIMTLSDHAPILMKVMLKGLQRVPYSWWLNEKLLEEDRIVEKIHQEIDAFFLNNDNEETPGVVIWEAFKAYIRVVLLSIGVWEKRERTKKKA